MSLLYPYHPTKRNPEQEEGLLTRTKCSESQRSCSHPGCGKVFADKSGLSRHRRQHLPVVEKLGKIAKCQWDGCSYESLRSDLVLKHFRRVHGRG